MDGFLIRFHESRGASHAPLTVDSCLRDVGSRYGRHVAKGIPCDHESTVLA